MRKVMLITKEIERKAPALRATEDIPVDEKRVVAKLFDPCGRWTFYLVEYDPEKRLAFGFVRSPLDPAFDELGYVDIAEVEETRNSWGIHMERDRYYGNAHTLGDVMNDKAVAQ